MRIVHSFPDNGTPAPEGLFDSFFDVFFDLHLDGNFLMSGEALLCQGLASALNPNCAALPLPFFVQVSCCCSRNNAKVEGSDQAIVLFVRGSGGFVCRPRRREGPDRRF